MAGFRTSAWSYHASDDSQAVALVSRNLGHWRIDVVLRHYLR
ncbi:MAG TPA: hypothetical protein VGP33_00255 [Chloroflexota bacterium]|jgi:hypothetical protein|nr:hypothetical protein [Chloroflexota bacterium]